MPACGQTVRHDVTLRGDLGPCPGDGLVVGADGITIDLGGHAIISASGAHTGIDTTGHRRITVRHGALRSFGVQIAARRPPTGSPVTADRFVGLRFVNSSFAVCRVRRQPHRRRRQRAAGGRRGRGGDYNVDGAHNVVRDTTAWSNLIGMAGADGHAHRNHVGQLTVAPHVAQPTTVDHNVAGEVSVGPGGQRARRWSAIVTRNVLSPPPVGSFNLNGIALQSVSHVLVSHNVVVGGPGPKPASGS